MISEIFPLANYPKEITKHIIQKCIQRYIQSYSSPFIRMKNNLSDRELAQVYAREFYAVPKNGVVKEYLIKWEYLRCYNKKLENAVDCMIYLKYMFHK